MTIWILAVLLFACCAAAGFFQGAIRAAISLAGLFCAAFLALPLGVRIKPLFPMMGVKNPIWLWLLPPLAVFVLISLVFLIIAFVAHKQVEVKYGHKFDEFRHLRWQRLNRRLGACVGILTGAVYLIIIGVIIAFLGALTVQVAAADESDPLALKLLNRARLDMRETGLEKTVSAFARPPQTYEDLADTFALVYHNPDLRRRISNYPSLLPFGERTEFQELGKDVEFNNLFATRGSLWALLNHPKVQEILQNGEIMENLKTTVANDIGDLKEFAQTGRSAKYGEEKILGRWELDPNASMVYVRKKHPNLTARELTLIKTGLGIITSGSFTATPDNKISLHIDVNADALKAAVAAATPATTVVVPQAQAQTSGSAPGMSAEMQRRYGIAGGRRPGAPPAAPPPSAPTPQIVQGAASAAPPANPFKDLKVSAQGTWQKQADKYLINIQNEDGKETHAEAVIDDDTLVMTRGGHPTVFYKVE